MLVADFGGGTTDYSLIRFETVAGRLTATPIGHSASASPAIISTIG